MTTRIGLVGAGRFANLHLHAYQSLPAQIVAVCDPDRNQRKIAQEKFNIPEDYSSLDEMLDRESIDLVDIVSDEASHSNLVLQALDAGKHVFVEKPLSMSEDTAQQIGKRASDRNLQVIAGHINRFGAGYQHLRTVLDRGDLGDLSNMRFRRDFSRSWFPDFGQRVHPVWESGIHDIDLAIWYANAPCQEVYAVEKYVSGLDYPDSFVAILTFANGIVATLDSAWLVPHAAPQTLGGALELSGAIDGAMELLGDHGAATYRSSHDGLSVHTDNTTTHPELTLWPTVDGKVSGAIVEELRYAIEVACGSRPNEVIPLNQAIESVRIAAAIQKAARDSTTISMENIWTSNA